MQGKIHQPFEIGNKKARVGQSLGRKALLALQNSWFSLDIDFKINGRKVFFSFKIELKTLLKISSTVRFEKLLALSIEYLDKSSKRNQNQSNMSQSLELFK